MNLITKNKRNGYTLIEIMLVIGLIAILMVSIFIIYQKIDNKFKADSVSKNLIMLSSNIDNSFSSFLSPQDLTNEFALSSNLVPKPLVLSNTSISNGYGGQLELGIDNSFYTITLKDIPNSVCGYLTATNFIRLAPGIKINSTTIKTSGPINSTHVSEMTASCNLGNEVTIVAYYPISFFDLPHQGIVDSGRNKELPQNIAKISGNENALACQGGAVWVENFCSCPAGSEWDGEECVVFGDFAKKAGWCLLGEGVNFASGQCEKLPHQNSALTPGEQSNKYQNGKYTTSASTTNRINNKQGPNINTIGQKEVDIGGKKIIYGEGYFDNNTLQVCVNGTWDNNSKSCVTSE